MAALLLPPVGGIQGRADWEPGAGAGPGHSGLEGLTVLEEQENSTCFMKNGLKSF